MCYEPGLSFYEIHIAQISSSRRVVNSDVVSTALWDDSTASASHIKFLFNQSEPNGNVCELYKLHYRTCIEFHPDSSLFAMGKNYVNTI
jgi:hypothetical protein